MNEDIKRYLKDALQVYNAVSPKKCEIPKLGEEMMELSVDRYLSMEELRHYLNYFSSWLVYFQSEHNRWKFVEEWLYSQSKQEAARLTLGGYEGKKYEKEAWIEIKLQPLRNAYMVARAKSFRYGSMAEAAGSQKEIISRQIALRDIEARAVGKE